MFKRVQSFFPILLEDRKNRLDFRKFFYSNSDSTERIMSEIWLKRILSFLQFYEGDRKKKFSWKKKIYLHSDPMGKIASGVSSLNKLNPLSNPREQIVTKSFYLREMLSFKF